MDFVNRITELEEFGRRVGTKREGPLALFLVAPSGVGKSRFLAEAALSYRDPRMIRVRVRRSHRGRYENGFFLLQTAAALHNAAESIDEIPTLAAFNSNITKYLNIEDIGLEATDEFMQDLDLPFINQIKTLIERQLSIGRFKPRALLGPNQAAGVSYLKLYVRTILESFPVALILENAHLMDEDALIFFSDTIDWPDTALVICEFTRLEDAPNGTTCWSIGELAEEFERAGFDISTMALTPLEFNHYKEIATQKGIGDTPHLREAYSREGGNIRAIYDLSAIVRFDPSVKIDRATARIALNALPRDQRFFAVALAVHDDPVPPQRLEAFHAAMDQRGPAPATTREAQIALQIADIISVDEQGAALAHDTLSKAITDDSDPALLALARSVWAQVYRSSSLEENEWLRLLRLLAEQGDAGGLDKALGNFLGEARRAHFKDELVETLTMAGRTFADETRLRASPLNQEVLRRIASILFEIEEYEEVEGIKAALELPVLRARLLDAALLDRCDEANEAIALAVPMAEDASLSIEDRLGFALVAIASFASLQRHDEAHLLYRAIVAVPGVAKVSLYPYLIRMTDIFLGLRDSLEPIRRSIELFSCRGDVHEAAHSRNAYGMQLARLGRLDEAKTEFSTADEALSLSSVDQAQILNNKAALRLMYADAGETTALYLTLSRDLVRRPFDQVVVALNFAVMASIRGAASADDAHASADKILSDAGLPDLGLRRTFAWNKSQWLKDRGDENGAAAALNIAKKLAMTHSELWRFRLFAEPIKTSDYAFQTNQKFHAPLLSKWHFPVPILDV